MKTAKSLLLYNLVGLFISCSSLAGTNAFYSIQSTISTLSAGDLGTHRPLKIAPPPVLYHWITATSLKQLFKGKSQPSFMPLKKVGTETYHSLLAQGAPGFMNAPGLFAWHNPVGASSGGSGEVYGNHEALLSLKIDPSARLGLVVTDVNHAPTEALSSPSLATAYDIILHVNSSFYDGEIVPVYKEWVILNPKAVISYTADPAEPLSIMKQLENALSDYERSGNKSDKAPLEVIAGPQHEGMGVLAINPMAVERLEKGLLKNQSRLGPLGTGGWRTFRTEIKACEALF